MSPLWVIIIGLWISSKLMVMLDSSMTISDDYALHGLKLDNHNITNFVSHLSNFHKSLERKQKTPEIWINEVRLIDWVSIDCLLMAD